MDDIFNIKTTNFVKSINGLKQKHPQLGDYWDNLVSEWNKIPPKQKSFRLGSIQKDIQFELSRQPQQKKLSQSPKAGRGDDGGGAAAVEGPSGWPGI